MKRIHATIIVNLMAAATLLVAGCTKEPTKEPALGDGVLEGLFNINGSGGQERFSQGNLQYQASTDTWRFAEHQWDYVGTQTADVNGYSGGTVSGSDNSDLSSTYGGWVDLFAWGTSGWNSGAVLYHPCDTGKEATDYSPGGSETNGLTGSYAEADWAWHNPISNGGDTAHLWRTLTQEEWQYLLNTRNTTSGIRYAKAEVNNIKGVILLPDNWSASYYTLGSINTDSVDFTANIISASTWAGSLESNGAVFLPAAGFRLGLNVYHAGGSGFYWSTTPGDEMSACLMHFCKSCCNALSGGSRCIGHSVRPVMDNN